MSLGAAATGQEQLDQLYDSFLHEKVAEEAAITKVSNRLQGNLNRMQDMIKEIGTQTSQFSTSLGDATERLDASGLNPADIQSIVAQLVEDARVTLEQNQALQHRLAESSQEMSDLKNDLASVREEAMTDALTGIANRKAFDMRLLQAAAETSEENQPLCLLIVDIDFFKKFNDTHGHQAGDQIIRLVAQTFKKGLKGQDTAARYGGEEFALILPNTSMDNALRVAEMLRRTVEHKEVINRANQEKLGQITISVGVAQYRAGESLESFIERADAALYRAKQNGRNRVEVETN
jgi:diguanylate cyclase